MRIYYKIITEYDTVRFWCMHKIPVQAQDSCACTGQGPGPGRTRLGHWPLRSLAHRVHGRWVPGPYLQSRNMTFGRILRFVSNL